MKREVQNTNKFFRSAQRPDVAVWKGKSLSISCSHGVAIFLYWFRPYHLTTVNRYLGQFVFTSLVSERTKFRALPAAWIMIRFASVNKKEDVEAVLHRVIAIGQLIFFYF